MFFIPSEITQIHGQTWSLDEVLTASTILHLIEFHCKRLKISKEKFYKITKISRSTLSGWRSGSRDPSLGSIQQISQRLGEYEKELGEYTKACYNSLRLKKKSTPSRQT